MLLAAGSAPVLDIDGTLLVQLALFLTLMAILNPLLFKPWLAVRERRAAAIDGALARAAELRERADALSADYSTKMTAIRDEALTMRSVERREVEATRQQTVADARVEAAAHLERERAKFATQSVEAREILLSRVDELAQQVANKILRRAS
ncbi:MAG: ATP synthase F0 subunit B [Nannocystaceae bacterium]|nr:ATP synthase F0 subunit B [Myxococcales bacterium]